MNASVIAAGQALRASTSRVHLAARQTGPLANNQSLASAPGARTRRSAGQSTRRNPSASTTTIVGPVHFEASAAGDASTHVTRLDTTAIRRPVALVAFVTCDAAM